MIEGKESGPVKEFDVTEDYIDDNDVSEYLSDAELNEIFKTKCEDSKTRYTEKLFQRFCKHYRASECIKILSFKSSGFGPRCSGVISDLMVQHEHFRVLNLSGNALGVNGSKVLSDFIKYTTHLISLDISSCSLNDDCCSMFFEALSRNKSIVQMNISSISGVTRNSFGEKTFLALEKMLAFNLVCTELNISQTEIPPSAVKTIAYGLAKNQTLEVLNISNNNCRSVGAIHIMNALKTSHLRELNFANNHIQDDVAPQFKNFFLVNKHLKKIDLSGNCFTYKFINAISDTELIDNKVLEDLNISKNAITGRCMDKFGYVIGRNNTIKRINMASCQIDSAGFQEFCTRFMENETLETLICHNNPIQDKGIIAFTNIIKTNNSLKEIDFEFCEMTDDATKQLFSAIGGSKSIQKVNVKNNLINNGEAVQHAILVNKNLVSINFEQNDIDYKMSNDINRLLGINQKRIKEEKNKKYDLNQGLTHDPNSGKDVREELKNATDELNGVRGEIRMQRNLFDFLKTDSANSEKELAEKTELYARKKKERDESFAKITHEIEELKHKKNEKSEEIQEKEALTQDSTENLKKDSENLVESIKRAINSSQELAKSIENAESILSRKRNELEKLKERYIAAQEALISSWETIKSNHEEAEDGEEEPNKEK